MKRKHHAVLIAAIAVLALLAIGAVTALDGDESTEQTDDGAYEFRSIDVSATGVADTTPDKAILRVSVTAEGDEVADVRDELAVGADALTTALDDLGVEYETREYDISQPRVPPEEREVPAYQGRHAFTITLDDPDRAGQVIDAAAGTGAEINDVTLTLSDDRQEQLRDEAIGAAMDDARQQADAIASSGGLEVVAVSSVSAGDRRFSPVAYDVATEVQEEDDAAPPTDIVTDDVSVSYTVSVTYEARTT